jgi:uncharacterized membrane protein YeaQ/YmgE (transglycosylase-associated protein family)
MEERHELLALIFWLLLGTGVLVAYRRMRRYSGWAAFIEVMIAVIGALIAKSAIPHFHLPLLHNPVVQIFFAAGGALLLAVAARIFVMHRE